MPSDVPCVAMLSPFQREMAQAQAPLVGTSAPCLLVARPQLCLTWGPGVSWWGWRERDSRVLPEGAPPGWEPCPARGGRAVQAAILSRVRQVVRCVLVFSHRGRKGHRKEKHTHDFQPQAEEPAGTLARAATPWTVVPGGCAPSTGPPGLRLRPPGSRHALSTSHCVRACPLAPASACVTGEASAMLPGAGQQARLSWAPSQGAGCCPQHSCSHAANPRACWVGERSALGTHQGRTWPLGPSWGPGT